MFCWRQDYSIFNYAPWQNGKIDVVFDFFQGNVIAGHLCFGFFMLLSTARSKRLKLLLLYPVLVPLWTLTLLYTIHLHLEWPSRALPSKNKPVPGSQMVERKKIAGGGGDTGAGANPQSPAPVSPGPLSSQLYYFFLSTIWDPEIGQKISHCCHHSPTRSLPKAALCTGCGYQLPAWRLRQLSVQNVP